LTVSVTVPFTVALRATGQTALPLKISAFAFGANTVLNYVFIFGNFGAPQLGVRGAALATAISRLLELSIMAAVVFGGKNIVAGKIGSYFAWNKDLFFRIIKNALPTTLNEALWGLGISMYNAAYGRIGVTAFAAVQAAATIQNMFSLACFSMGDATLIVLGGKLGRSELDEAFSAAKKILRLCVAVGLAAGLVMFLSSKFLVRLFKFSPDGFQYVQAILMIYSVVLAAKIYNGVIITGVLRCGGDTRFAMFADLAGVWFIGVPLAFLGALFFKLPVHLVVALVQIEELVKLSVTYYRYKSKKWVRNVIHGID
jgi:putative MATE family efflux protein